MSREVFFVGSIPMASAREVFQSIGAAFGAAVRRIPDGETGNRLGWLEWQEPFLAANPLLEATVSEGDWRNATAPDKWKHKKWFRLRAGASARDVVLGDVGYARNAKASYADFAALKREGKVAPGTRFMVAIPSPFNLVNHYFAPDERAALEPAYEAALLREVDEIAAAVPAGELAIQWDCAHDMQAYDGEARKPWFPDTEHSIEARLIRIGQHVPPAVELGYHFCYGSFGGKHFVEPKDMGAMVRLANALSTGVTRPIGWIHMPIPIDRSDDGYFAPLAALRLKPGMTLYLGLIHDKDGVAGTMRRIDAAERHIKDFGIATECGFGRRPPETVRALVDLHAEVARQT
jgi:methionine synthase II (cobalamin-independent)